MIYPETIKVNGSVFDRKLLSHLKNVVDEDNSMNLWEKEIYDFILEWFSPNESVLVQDLDDLSEIYYQVLRNIFS